MADWVAVGDVGAICAIAGEITGGEQSSLTELFETLKPLHSPPNWGAIVKSLGHFPPEWGVRGASAMWFASSRKYRYTVAHPGGRLEDQKLSVNQY